MHAVGPEREIGRMITTPKRFILFGMGSRRRKLLYAEGGRLLDALTLEAIRTWDLVGEEIHAAEYRVALESRDGRRTIIEEDQEGVWLREAGDRIALTTGCQVCLPRFEGHPYSSCLRALHAELLVNLMPVGPVPNLWVYPRPWYRDAAMMLMCLKQTGNLPLVEDWVMGLHKVWDRNNNGEPEADNLGQILFMASLFGAHSHPVVKKVVAALPAYHRDGYVVGKTDGAEHPVYQTKWLKFGLRSLCMDDPYRIPPVFDPYSALFWMDYRDDHVDGQRFSERMLALYPYLNWAEAHFHNDSPPEVLTELRPPITREGAGSEAEYWRLNPLAREGIIPAEQIENRICGPHTWHAAEMFLYLIEKGQPAGAGDACQRA
jgi:hypothetical protein